MNSPSHQEVLDFWFREIDPKSWWSAAVPFDDLVRTRFGHLLQQVSAGEHYSWRQEPLGRLAEIVVLDQFSRNIHRSTPQAFSQDATALVLAQEAIAHGALAVLSPIERTFLLMPYMHSESRVIHALAAPLFQQHTPKENHEFELRHQAIVDRFGRYPHRNQILGRPSTDAEIEFLKQPGSRF